MKSSKGGPKVGVDRFGGTRHRGPVWDKPLQPLGHWGTQRSRGDGGVDFYPCPPSLKTGKGTYHLLRYLLTSLLYQTDPSVSFGLRRQGLGVEGLEQRRRRRDPRTTETKRPRPRHHPPWTVQTYASGGYFWSSYRGQESSGESPPPVCVFVYVHCTTLSTFFSPLGYVPGAWVRPPSYTLPQDPSEGHPPLRTQFPLSPRPSPLPSVFLQCPQSFHFTFHPEPRPSPVNTGPFGPPT